MIAHRGLDGNIVNHDYQHLMKLLGDDHEYVMFIKWVNSYFK